MENHYQLLGIQPTATADEVKRAYSQERARRIAQGGDEGQLTHDLGTLDAAYATLADPSQRAAYDRSAQNGATALMLAAQPSPHEIMASPPPPVLQQACPYCGAPNPVQATNCRECGHQVSRPCPICSQPVLLTQSICSRCQTYMPEYDQQRFTQTLAVERQIQQERTLADVRTNAADATYRAGIRVGTVFWVVVAFACIGLMVLASLLSAYLN